MTEKVPYAGLKDFVAGSFGGLGLVFAGHPFIKVKMQTGGVGTNFVGCVKDTFRQGGVLGFYAGALSPMIGLAAMNSVLFYSYMLAVRQFQKDGKISNLDIKKVALCGGIGGFFCSFVEGPQDLLKCKLQSGQTEASGSISCLLDITRRFGFRGMLQGIGSTWIRNIPANAAYMGFYEFMKRKFGGGDSAKATKLQILCSGGIAGIFYWVSSYPFDVIKSVVQTQPSDPTKRTIKGFSGAAKFLMAEYGLAGYFRGFLPCMLRSFPANACCFFAYEVVKKFITPFGMKKEEEV